MTNLFEIAAMGLDTLPDLGRFFLLSLLLSLALYGVGRGIKNAASDTMRLFYLKASAVALLLVPAVVAILGVQMPVYVEQARAFNTEVPALVSYAVVSIWLLGALVQLVRLLLPIVQEASVIKGAAPAGDKIAKRLLHWQRRIGYQQTVNLYLQGGKQGHHIGRHIKLPVALEHWPSGLLDVVLLAQLVQVKQGAHSWYVRSLIAQALYWPMPWVKALFAGFAEQLVAQSVSLAEAAFRDPEGFRRDWRKVNERYETLEVVATGNCLPSPLPAIPTVEKVESEPFDWQATKARRAERHYDPYERVYWLIAAACVMVAIGTTLTIRQASPEFEPRFLNVRWQDQMGRRIPERTDIPAIVDQSSSDTESK